jgi:hypothetical protein
LFKQTLIYNHFCCFRLQNVHQKSKRFSRNAARAVSLHTLRATLDIDLLYVICCVFLCTFWLALVIIRWMRIVVERACEISCDASPQSKMVKLEEATKGDADAPRPTLWRRIVGIVPEKRMADLQVHARQCVAVGNPSTCAHRIGSKSAKLTSSLVCGSAAV